jgi:hypothetical protein
VGKINDVREKIPSRYAIGSQHQQNKKSESRCDVGQADEKTAIKVFCAEEKVIPEGIDESGA